MFKFNPKNSNRSKRVFAVIVVVLIVVMVLSSVVAALNVF